MEGETMPEPQHDADYEASIEAALRAPRLRKADDLFAGAGGWDLAARSLGIHARGVENMPEARATREAAGLTTIHDDVWTYVPDGEAAGLIASPPCQTFSAAGKGAGSKALDDVLGGIWSGAFRSIQALQDLGEKVGDARTALVLTPLHFALIGGYRWLAWEQVPTVLPVWEACAEVLKGEGWSTWTGHLHAEQYGVPQTRKRALLLASLDGEVGRPAPTHSNYHPHDPKRLDDGVLPWLSMADGIGWGLAERPSPTTVTGGGTETGGAEPIAKLARYTGRSDWRPRAMAGSGTSCTIVDPRPLDEPAQTITGSGTAEWGTRTTRAPGKRQRDPDGVRLIPAECGLLQTFPIDHPWQGNLGRQHLQAGNAIPPMLALHALRVAAGVKRSEVAA